MPLAGSGDSSQSLAVETPMAIATPAHLYGDCASPSAAFYGVPLAGSGDSCHSLAVETPMAIATPAHLYGDCASPSAAFYGEQSSYNFGHDSLGPSPSPFGIPKMNTGASTPPPAGFEGELLCAGAPQSFSSFMNPSCSAAQPPVQPQQQLLSLSAALPQLPVSFQPVVTSVGDGGMATAEAGAAAPGAQPVFPFVPDAAWAVVVPTEGGYCANPQDLLAELREHLQQGAGGAAAPVVAPLAGGAGGAAPLLTPVVEMQQPAMAPLAGQQFEQRQPLQKWQQFQPPQNNMVAPTGAPGMARQHQNEQQQQTPHQQQQHSNNNGNQSTLVTELHQEAVGSVFLSALLEAASLLKEDERLTLQLEDKRRAGRRQLDRPTKTRLESARIAVRRQREQVAWRLSDLVEQHGVRPELQEEALRAILPRCRRTATDSLGRHVLEKFFEVGSAESKSRLAREGLSGGVLPLSLHQHGCHVIQAALPAVALEDAQEALVPELQGRVSELVESPHGNHVLQKLLMTIPAPCLGFVVQECLPRAATLAKHVYGCRILQRLLETYTLSSEPMESLLEVLLGEDFPELVTDPYGNYVLQHLIMHGRTQDRRRLIQQLQSRVSQYAMHRCSSNLVEMALRAEEVLVTMYEGPGADLEMKGVGWLAGAILGMGKGADVDSAPIFAMAQDKYGNHVVQRMLSRPDSSVRELAAARLRSRRQKLEQGVGARYAKHVLAVLDSMPAVPAASPKTKAVDVEFPQVAAPARAG